MIYYSHANEDSHAERTEMHGETFNTLIAIAGSGERIIALMDHDTLENIHIVDINKEALFLTELKINAITHLTPSEYLTLIAYDNKKVDRISLYEKIDTHLSEPCRNYWDQRIDIINKGILLCGHFELFLKRIRPIIKLVLGQNFFNVFLDDANAKQSFPTFRWRIIKFLFSLRFIYKLFGMKDEAFVSKDALLNNISNALDQSITENKVNHSFMFHLIFKGHLLDMPEEYLPYSFRINIISSIKSKINNGDLKINYHYSDALQFIESFSHNESHSYFYSLSDLLSFIDHSYIRKLLNYISDNKTKNTLVVLRAFIKNRIDQESIRKELLELQSADDISYLDRTNFYQVLKIYF